MAASGGLLLVAAVSLIFAFNVKADQPCHEAASNWTAKDVEDCVGKIVPMIQGDRTLDFSTWTEENFKKVFDDQEKAFSGNVIIDGSESKQIVMVIESGKTSTTITVANCPNLETLDLGLDVRANMTPPLIRVSGNRKLSLSSINDLEYYKTDDHYVKNESHIQIENECMLKDANGKVTTAEADLERCTAIYGDFRITNNDAFSHVMAKIKELKYIQGCLEISGTDVTLFNNITFLINTYTIPGGCTTEHKITNNAKMCIHPPEAHELQQRFPSVKIIGNANCDGECVSYYVMKLRDPGCKIILDSLVVTGNEADFDYLKNIKEIKGTLKIENISIVNFNFLNNLEKLNTDNISSAPIISLSFNKKLKSFDLPKLNVIGVNPGQVSVYEENNGDFKVDDNLFNKLGLNKANAVQNVALTTEVPTTPMPNTTAKSSYVFVKPAAYAISIAAILGIIGLISCVAGVLIVCSYNNKVTWALNKGYWLSSPISAPLTPIGPICYVEKKPRIADAEKRIAVDMDIIAQGDKKHLDNVDHKLFTFLNSDAPSFFSTPEEKEDFEKYDAKRKAEEYNESNIDLPAYKKDEEGKRIPTKTTQKIEYQHQCDAVGYAWNECNIPPVRVEKFSKTAKRMVHLGAVRMYEGLLDMLDDNKEIQMFGIDFHSLPEEIGESVASRDASPSSKYRTYLPHWPKCILHRYDPSCDVYKTPENNKKYYWVGQRANEEGFVERMVTHLLNMPAEEKLNIAPGDVIRVMKLAYSVTFKHPRKIGLEVFEDPANGEFAHTLDKKHVRIVGETRGNFDALRKALSIPSIIGDKKDQNKIHPLLQYNWVFLGNYTSSHPQSLETILLLLGLQYLMKGSVILLRGPLEFKEMSEQCGFKALLELRFHGKKGTECWKKFNEIFASFPLNCEINDRILCTCGGFSEADYKRDFADPKEVMIQELTLDSTNWDKVMSLPNYTVKYFSDNVDTWSGYYYGERILTKVAQETEMATFFTTAPMETGFGLFGDATPCYLYALSSVVGLEGHGEQTTKMAVVAEVNSETECITIHGILEGDETFAYDRVNEKICRNVKEAQAAGLLGQMASAVISKTGTKKDDPASQNTASGVKSTEGQVKSKVVSGSKEAASKSKETMTKSKVATSGSKEATPKTSQLPTV